MEGEEGEESIDRRGRVISPLGVPSHPRGGGFTTIQTLFGDVEDCLQGFAPLDSDLEVIQSENSSSEDSLRRSGVSGSSDAFLVSFFIFTAFSWFVNYFQCCGIKMREKSISG
ncbi:hypothetical protein NPIL_551921 [Nephila pilipes]|uniref:Uncharacterized protein n=1 Tax=Nephila pilipes TaxID=299642 RepID=A0A8X6TM57_NEPPI|nr:hypothetical protein NPIL_551921 [Nephila pilipes]